MISRIEEHLLCYPEMEAGDVLKLIYQSIFGGGHMITDAGKSRMRIEQEFDAVKHSLPKRNSPVEMLGNGICRIYLNVLQEGLSVSTLNRMFVDSASRRQGTIVELEKNIQDFANACADGRLPFDYQKVEALVSRWQEQGYPAVSHSEQYRNRYMPAYRVIDAVYGEYYKVILEIDRLLKREEKNDRPIIVAIDGMAGSGKSTLGTMLQELYQCNLFHMDDFFLQSYQRTTERLNAPGGNVDYERFKKEIYDQIDTKTEFVYQKYDCSRQELGEKVSVSYKKLNIIEGAYSAHPYFQDRADLVFFKEIPAELQKERIALRNGEWMLQRFLKEWIPMEHNYFDTFSIRKKSIVIAEIH